MTAFWSKLQETLPKAIGSMSALLSPSSRACSICGRSGRGAPSSNNLPLCTACSRAIPWITRIMCPICGRAEQCTDCSRRTDTSFLLNRSAVRYDSTIRHWLAMYKYRGHEALEPLLGEMLAAAYQRMMRDLLMRDASHRFDAIIPVPVSEERRIERGFNQAERLASYLAEQVNLPVHEVLVRMRHSAKQSFKTRGARLLDSRNLFAVDHSSFLFMLEQIRQGSTQLAAKRSSAASREKLADDLNSPAHRPVRFLIIDDIYTTGSTVNACAAALSRSFRTTLPDVQAEIFILTLARS
ncbi:ComF family protein [Paenibacillus solisilvae]|uniref:ComF family protein n=1 Tax=Paenibacillus solisilvae TaxID=2486751 RepID=A0ABW0W4F4_9BACL